MSMDPSKWIPFDRLKDSTKERIQQYYPYLKLDHCVFQEKASGVYMKAVNNVKIEKLLDPEGGLTAHATPPPQPRAAASSGGRTRSKSS